MQEQTVMIGRTRRATFTGRTLAAAILALGSATTLAAETPLQTLQALVDQRQFSEAYALSNSILLDFEGEPEFDFNYGLAALETGDYPVAIFALERVLLNLPGEDRVRLELARAYYLAGNLAAARRELDRVLANEPPRAVRANVEQFLDNIDERERREGARFTRYIGLGAGYDSNVNSATDDPTTTVPLFGTLTLSQDGRELSDEFYRLQGGVGYTRPLSKTSSIDLSLDGDLKANLDESQFDLGILRASAGYNLQRGDDLFRVGVRAQYIGLDYENFQNGVGVTVGWRRDLGDGWQIGLDGAATMLRYPELEPRNAEQYLLSGRVGRQVGATNHAVALFAAVEPNAEGGAAEHNGRSFWGANYSMQWRASSRWLPFASLTWQGTDYDDNHPVFGVVRSDDLLSVQGGVVIALTRALQARLQGSTILNDSNINVFEYDRTQFEAQLRYDF